MSEMFTIKFAHFVSDRKNIKRSSEIKWNFQWNYNKRAIVTISSILYKFLIQTIHMHPELQTQIIGARTNFTSLLECSFTPPTGQHLALSVETISKWLLASDKNVWPKKERLLRFESYCQMFLNFNLSYCIN